MPASFVHPESTASNIPSAIPNATTTDYVNDNAPVHWSRSPDYWLGAGEHIHPQRSAQIQTL